MTNDPRTSDGTAPAINQQSYPTRPPFFAMKYLAYILRAGLAMDFGPRAVLLLTIIAITEDKIRYRKAVRFWNDNLTAFLGCREDKLSEIRKQLSLAGWLHYVPGRKGVPGQYWVTAPGGDECIDDSILGENLPPEAHGDGSETAQIPPGNTGGKTGDNRQTENVSPRKSVVQRGGQRVVQRGGQWGAILPIPKPTPNPSEESAQAETIVIPSKLLELIRAWNDLPEGIASRVVKPGAKSILAGWKRIQSDPDAAECFEDVPTLMEEIEAGTFLHGSGWFDFGWLFGKAQDRSTWNVSKVLAGKYRQRQQQANSRFDATMQALTEFSKEDSPTLINFEGPT